MSKQGGGHSGLAFRKTIAVGGQLLAKAGLSKKRKKGLIFLTDLLI